jgi:phenylalanine ammonia-lyase
MVQDSIKIDGNSLTIRNVYDVSIQDQKIDFPESKDFWNKLENSRNFLDNYIKKGFPIYGVTTGFGDSCHNQISPEKSEKLQKSLVNFHGVGIGEYFSEEEGRAVILARLNSNIKGYSAITLNVAKLMKELLNHRITPVIPKLGSVGASGDLTPLSYLAAVLMGERKVYYKGNIVETLVAFNQEGLKPVKLQAKEGLALMNGTSVMTAIASLCWGLADKASKISDFITGATVEIIKGNDIPYRSKVSEIKNHTGQIASANYIENVIKDSKRVFKYEKLLDKLGTIKDNDYRKTELKIQDRYSVRCSPQINGVLRDTLIFTKTWIENELNSANDNPLIDAENEIIYNSGNFYGGHICGACDYLRIALANIADLSDKQAELIIDGKFNNLTENLIAVLPKDSENYGLFHGFKAAQISISALCSEINFLSNPVSIHSRPSESLNQDKVSLGTISSRKLKEVLDMLYFQLAIHILAICQAVDIAGKDNFGTFTKKVYNEIRKISSFVMEDRPLEDDVRAVADFLKKTDIF